MDKLLLETLQSVSNEFKKDELAYLALTSKIEIPIRDRWAFVLYEKFSEKYSVAREWKRTDLAILDNLSPVALIELKAMYSFDGIDNSQHYINKMCKDASKALKLSNTNTHIYTVLLSTHPHGMFAKELDGIIKYLPNINRTIRKYGNEEVKRICKDNIEKSIQGEIIGSGKLFGGSSFGVDVDVCFWLVKANNMI